MSPTNYTMIGLMSGTSGDGLDMAHCSYELHDQWSYEILDAVTVPFPKEIGEKLMNSHKLTALELALLDVDFGKPTSPMKHLQLGGNIAAKNKSNR